MQRVYCGSRLGRISVFDLADGAPIPAEEIGPFDGDVGTIDVSADGAVLTVISGSEPIISRWHLEGIGLGGRLVAPRPVAGGTVFVRGLVRRDGTPGRRPVPRRRALDDEIYARVSSRVSSSWTRRPAV